MNLPQKFVQLTSSFEGIKIIIPPNGMIFNKNLRVTFLNCVDTTIQIWLNLDISETILILAEDAGLYPADLSRLFWLTDKDSRPSLRSATRKLRPKMRRENSVALAKMSI